MSLDTSWLDTLRPAVEEGELPAIQIHDVQVVDAAPSPFDASMPSLRKGSDFLEVIAETETTKWKSAHVLVFGCTSSGESVLIRVDDFRPSMFYEATHAEALLRIKIAETAKVAPESLRIVPEKKMNMYGWVPESMSHPVRRCLHNYFRVFFPTVKSMRRAAAEAAENDMYCHENKVTPDAKFLDDADLTASGWLTVSSYALVPSEQRISHCCKEIMCRMRFLHPVDRPEIAPLLVAFIDIEAISATNSFPDASIRDDVVCMIGAVFWRVGTPASSAVKAVFVTPEYCGHVEGAHVMRYSSERDMLSDFRSRLVVDIDPDVIATYNGFGFDLPYLWKRAEMHNVDDFFYMDRIICRKCPAQQKELSSSALGQNELFIVEMFGRSNLDLYNWIKANEKLDSYKLDDVSEHFLKEKKLDMDYKDLFRMSRGSANEVAKVALYCVQDCFLLVLLSIRLQIFASNIEMSRVTHTPLEMLVTRGQQIKVVNQLNWHGHRMDREADQSGGYVMNTPRQFSGRDTDTYEGATVIDAKAKYYRDPIATLDFMSLYPSIILANNFCFSTLVQDEKYAHVPGVEYAHIKVSDEKEYLWAKNMPGVIPVMLRSLLSARKQAKKLMAEAGKRVDTLSLLIGEGKADCEELKTQLARAVVEKAVYDARQKALKISANSIYGATGAVKHGNYPCLAIADCVTFRAREMLHQTVDWVHEYTRMYCEGECDVVYGDTDSIMVKFFGVTEVAEAAEIGERAANWITDRFASQTGTADIVLEFEKVYCPYLLMRKKRYAGLMFEANKDGKMVNTKLDAKGIELIRRDNCALAKRVQKKALDALMYMRDPSQACKDIQEELQKIVDDQVDILDYKMSKSRRKDYVNHDLAHLRVVDKMAKRNPGSEPQVGDRVPYVLIVVPNNAKAKVCDKAEDIAYVLANPNSCKIDRLYYVEHQIEKSICSLMEFVIQSPGQLFEHCKRQLTLQQTNQRTLDAFFTRPPKAQAHDATHVAMFDTTPRPPRDTKANKKARKSLR